MPANSIDKLIVTDVSALKAKYDTDFATVKAAVDDLMASDVARGLTVKFIALDSATQMGPYGGAVTASSGVAWEKETKAAIDALYNALSPAYIMILGAPDVIPHQGLKNSADDEDDEVPSDLPYACDAPYSTSIAKFVGPTRVVGRLPDLEGGTDAAYLVKLLKVAEKWKSSPRAKYDDHLALTAEVWHDSTDLSITNLFTAATGLKDCPPGGPSWTTAQLKPLSHFFNCHGSTPDNQFYGQKGEDMPVCMQASQIDGKIAAGTVVSAECCYGAELYDPSLTNNQPGICSVYLANKAYAFFGSTTIAYGPPEGNSAADLVCQYFLKHVLAGASTGRAALQARLDFVKEVGHLDPIDLKTLGQFHLLGDPSVQPVALPPKAPAAKSKSLIALVADVVERESSRAVRRTKLAMLGAALEMAASVARPDAALQPSAETRKVLNKLAEDAKLGVKQMGKYALSGAKVLASHMHAKGLKAVEKAPTSYFIMSGLRDAEDPRTRVAFVAKEQAGELIGVRELHRR